MLGRGGLGFSTFYLLDSRRVWSNFNSSAFSDRLFVGLHGPLVARDEDVPPLAVGELDELLERSLLDCPRPEPQLPERGQRGQSPGGRHRQVQFRAAHVEDAQPGETVAREEVGLEVAVVEEVGEVTLEAEALELGTA